MGKYIPVATPRLGQRRRTQTAKLGCGNNNRACPMIPSARDRVVWGLLAAEPAFAFAGTRSQSVAVRSGEYEPPFCQYGGWTVAAVRKTNNFLCPKTRPFIRTQKRPNLPQGVSSSVSNVDFFRLTLAAPAYSMCTAIHSERKSRAFLICNLVFGNFGNRLIVCGAANLLRGVESIHNLQYAVHYQIPRRFSLIKRA